MNLTSHWPQKLPRLRTTLLRIGLLILLLPPGPLKAICPTVCKEPLDFCRVKKCMNAKPLYEDSFKEDDGPFGITASGIQNQDSAPVLGPEQEVEAILNANPELTEEINMGELLDELQKEGNQYLGEDFGVGPRITLEEAIYLSLRDNEGVGFGDNAGNTGITTAYLNREIAKESLKTTINTFRPQWDWTLNANYAETHNRNDSHNHVATIPTPSINTKIPLKWGGAINLNWGNTYIYNKPAHRPSSTTATTSLNFNITQPLLKGAGFTIGTLPLTQAYLNDESSVLTLKATVISVVTQTIQTYRNYKQAIDEFNIQKRSIEESRKDLEKTKLLVEAGTRARADIIEGQYSLAQRELSFQDARNRVDQTRITFLRVLNMDTSLNIVPDKLADTDLEPEDLPSIEQLTAIAFLNNPDYLSQLISLRQAELNYIVARNNVLWDLTFNAGIQTSVSRSSLGRSNQNAWDFRDRTVNAGLTLVIPFNNLGTESTLIDSKINLRTSKINLAKREQDLIASIRDNLRNVKKNIIQYKLTKVNVMLAKQRLVQKRIEIEAGISSSFELTSILDQFITAESDELNAQITLANSITDMDALLGTTLDTWEINLNNRLESVPKLDDTLVAKLQLVKHDPKENQKVLKERHRKSKKQLEREKKEKDQNESSNKESQNNSKEKDSNPYNNPPKEPQTLVKAQ